MKNKSKHLSCIALIDNSLDKNESVVHILEKTNFFEVFLSCSSFRELLIKDSVGKFDVVIVETSSPDTFDFSNLQAISDTSRIIITAKSGEFAVLAYDYGIRDFLLIPYDSSRLIRAIGRVINNKVEEYPPVSPIKIKSGKSIIYMHCEEILYVEGFGNYIKIFTLNHMYLTLEKISSFAERINCNEIFRCHKSYLINKQHITSVMEETIIIAGKFEIPIGQTYKKVIGLNYHV